jgi:hypothetical protein
MSWNVVMYLIIANKKEILPPHIISVWNDFNKTKSLVNYFALSLCNPKPIISFARKNGLFDKITFCQLTQYCWSNTAADNARILEVSTSPASIKYKFGIQVPKRIKNAIDLDKKNAKCLFIGIKYAS